MVLLIVAMIICIIIWVNADNCSSYLKGNFIKDVDVFFFCIIALIVMIPFNGYNDWELVQETNLENINEEKSGNPTYLVVNDDCTYEYKSDEENHKLEEHLLVEYSSDKHVLQEYKQTPKRTFWNEPLTTKYKYIFIVPEESITIK